MMTINISGLWFIHVHVCHDAMQDYDTMADETLGCTYIHKQAKKLWHTLTIS